MQPNFAALLGNVEAALDQWCTSDGANAHTHIYIYMYILYYTLLFYTLQV